jgi:serine/threonine-protein kinase
MPPIEWNKLEEVFQAALEVPPEERRAWLERRCGEDAELHAKVSSLLAAEAASTNFLPKANFAKVVGALMAESGEAREGQRVGPYKILREVGRGGMGVVFLAEREDEQFRQLVAIKVVKRGLDTEEILRRFRNERQILASLNHANIAQLFDGGETPDGRPYFVMEYVEGLPLLRYCDERGLSIKERLQLFRRACSPVSYAHQNLVVHRDLKPSNILITLNAEGEATPKLLDFGVAKIMNPELAGQTQTQALHRVMTPEYASPEQVRGGPVTTATDVYSLGVILYELLTGARPFDLRNSTPEEMSRLICDAEPSKPSDAATDSQTDSRPETNGDGRKQVAQSVIRNSRLLKGDLDNIVLKALRKEPGRRYKSVDQLSEDIRRHLEGLPVIARKDTFGYRASKFIGRNRVGVAAAALILLAIVAGLITTVWQARVAARERNQARREAAKADQLNNFLKSILSAASPEQKGIDVKVVEVLNDAAGRIETEFAGQPELRAQALQTVGATYGEMGLYDEAEKYLRESLRINLEVNGAESKATATVKMVLGEALLSKAKYDEAEKLLNESIATEQRLSAAGSKELASGFFLLGELYIRANGNSKEGLERAKQLLQQSLSIYRAVADENSEDPAFALISLARAHQYSGDLDAAEANYRKSIAIFRNLPPRYEVRMALALINLGRLLSSKGSFDEGINTTLEADRIVQKLGVSYTVFMSKYYLCWNYHDKGDYVQAVEAGTKALEMGRQLKMTNTPDFFYLQTYLGGALVRTGRAKEAEPVLRESLDWLKANTPQGIISIAASKGALGECLSAQARYGEAEPLLLESYEVLKNSKGGGDQRTKLALRRLVSLYESWKKPDEAARYRSNL